jgi:hypothetical protein
MSRFDSARPPKATGRVVSKSLGIYGLDRSGGLRIPTALVQSGPRRRESVRLAVALTDAPGSQPERAPNRVTCAAAM